MRTYLVIFHTSFKKNLAYRSEVWLRIVGSLVGISIQAAIWRAVLRQGTPEGIVVQDMVTYAILNSTLSALLMDRIFREVDERLRSGDIAVDLLKPLRYPVLLFAEQLGKTAFQFLFTVIPTVVIAGLVFGFRGPASLVDLLAYIVSLGLALGISFAIGYLIALLGFWFIATFHFEWALIGLFTVFSGSFLPLWFFPPRWAAVAQMLPFQYMGFVPAALYMGRLPRHDIVSTLGLGILWMGILLGLISWLWSRSIRRLIVQGG